MPNAIKRIPVTEERWKELGELKEPGQTWDDVLAELVDEHKKARLFRDMNEIEERTDENDDWIALDDLPPEEA